MNLIKKWRGLLKKNDFLKNTVILIGGTTFAQIINLAVQPILTRLYSPNEMGVYAIYLSLVTVLAVTASLKYELAIPLPQKNKSAIKIVILSLCLLLIYSILVFILIIFFKRPLSNLMNAPQLINFLWMLPFSVFFIGFYQIFSYLAIRFESFGDLSKTKLTQSIGQNISQLIFGVSFPASIWLVLGDLVGKISSTATLMYLQWNQIREILIKNLKDIKTIKHIANRYKKFPLYTTWASLINVLSLNLPIFLLPIFFNVNAVGHYSLAFRIIGLPVSLIGSVIGQVYLSKASQLINNPNKLQQLTENTTKSLFALGVPLFSIVLFVGPSLFVWVFGNEWGQSGEYAQLLALWCLFWIVSSPLSNILIVKEQQKFSLAFTFFELLLRYFSIHVGFFINSIKVSLLLLSISGVIISIISISWFLYLCSSSIKNILLFFIRITSLVLPLNLLLYGLSKIDIQLDLLVILSLIVVVTNYYFIYIYIPEVKKIFKES
jgi:lipopolysaccharide exporter